MYIITVGRVAVTLDKQSTDSSQAIEIGAGEFFFGLEFKDEPIKTVKATTNGIYLMIRKQDYNLLVEPFLDWDDSSFTDNEFSESSFELKRGNTRRVEWELNDFKTLAVAGSGSFGDVKLVRAGEGDNKEVFALKIVNKNRAINRDQGEHMKNERRVMFLLDSPFIVKLFATYKDEHSVYLLIEMVLGGDLYSFLRKRKRFDEPMSRFYIGCVVLAFQHVHSHNLIYRDLKPENLLISREGYIKLTDFGFAKLRNQSTSLCGTPEYVAPELITGGVQNFGVDWWCLGILLYEILVGRVPFQDTEDDKMYMHILKSAVEVPKNLVSRHAQELIHKLLMKNAWERLGSGRSGVEKIKQQEWFNMELESNKESFTFSWAKLSACELEAPYKPILKDDEDCTHFDPDSSLSSEKTELGRPFSYSLYRWCEEF